MRFGRRNINALTSVQDLVRVDVEVDEFRVREVGLLFREILHCNAID